jgi:hypothetical protein
MKKKKDKNINQSIPEEPVSIMTNVIGEGALIMFFLSSQS